MDALLERRQLRMVKCTPWAIHCDSKNINLVKHVKIAIVVFFGNSFPFSMYVIGVPDAVVGYN